MHRIDAGSDLAAVLGGMSQFRIAVMPAEPAGATLGTVRCLLVDDSRSFLDAASILLERQGLDICGTASTTAEGLRQAADLRPDVVLVDITLGSDSGLDLARRLPRAAPRASVILISTHAEADFADLLEQTPSAGFVPKSELSAAVIRRLAGADPEV